MNEECSVCMKKVDKVSMISVNYKLLLGNEFILQRSEEHAPYKIKLISGTNNMFSDDYELKPLSVRKATIGIPYFLRKLHPNMTFKEFQAIREEEHFLINQTKVCEECYLLVSKEFEGGFPYKLTEPKKRPATTANTFRKDNLSIHGEVNTLYFLHLPLIRL